MKSYVVHIRSKNFQYILMTFSQKFKALENICVETLTLKKTKKLKGDVLCQRSKVTFVDPRIMVSQNKKKHFLKITLIFAIQSISLYENFWKIIRNEMKEKKLWNTIVIKKCTFHYSKRFIQFKMDTRGRYERDDNN